MAYYLVTAHAKKNLLAELERKLSEDAFMGMDPFGKALSFSLRHARVQAGGKVVWEEEDYCSPPLAEEKKAVLDYYFTELQVERINKGEGWKQISALPYLFSFVS